MNMTAYEKLIAIQKQNNSKLCVGLDTSIELIPAHFDRKIESIFEFNKQIIKSTSELVCAYKLNFAFYEQYGSKGFEILKRTFDIIRWSLKLPTQNVAILEIRRLRMPNLFLIILM